jgi:YggT family protein
MIIIYYLLVAFDIVLFVRVALSWFPNVDRSQQWVRLVFQITEPVLRPVRNALPQTGMVDWSPTVVFLIIFVLMQLLRGF